MRSLINNLLIVALVACLLVTVSVYAFTKHVEYSVNYEDKFQDLEELDRELADINSNLDLLFSDVLQTKSYIEGLPFRPKIAVSSRGIISNTTYYDYSDLTKRSYVSAEFLDRHLANTPLANLGEYFVIAEKLYGINAVFLCALAIHESNWGRSKLAREKNNLFGFTAYNNSVYKSAKKFDSKEECILFVAGYLAYNYLDERGKHYNGKSINAINKLYAVNDDMTPNLEWGQNIKLLMQKLIK
ncbi:MAG: glucosaminidase domain-containing protein [Thermosipho sp. (in: Bacteria)]|nr:glucosaminidase domain-containing protein [Thermosipho sp. (in: thermotogales)]